MPEISVEVAYVAQDGTGYLKALTLPVGTTVRDAVEKSGVVALFGLDTATIPVGIFGKKTTGETVLKSGDRVEIYRPLIADPKEARRRRVKEV